MTLKLNTSIFFGCRAFFVATLPRSEKDLLHVALSVCREQMSGQDRLAHSFQWLHLKMFAHAVKHISDNMWQFAEHQKQREQRVPRVSVISYDIERAWTAWLKQQGCKSQIVLNQQAPSDLAREFVSEALAGSRLETLIRAHLEHSLGYGKKKLAAWLEQASEQELMARIGRVMPAGRQQALRELCFHVLRRKTLLSVDLGIADAAADLLQPELICAVTHRITSSMEAVGTMYRFSLDCPTIPCALVSDTATIETIVERETHQRWHAWFHDGVVRPSDKPKIFPKSIDLASHPERLLFEALQKHKLTRGLFVLNARIEEKFGNANMEIDLLSDTLQLAIEIDGYFHFTDISKYRRDRLKDLRLQQLGYQVMRLHADDVIENLPSTMERVIQATEHRKAEIK